MKTTKRNNKKYTRNNKKYKNNKKYSTRKHKNRYSKNNKKNEINWNKLYKDEGPLQPPIGRMARNPRGPYNLTGLGFNAPNINNVPERFTREYKSGFESDISDEFSSFLGGKKDEKKTYLISNIFLQLFH